MSGICSQDKPWPSGPRGGTPSSMRLQVPLWRQGAVTEQPQSEGRTSMNDSNESRISVVPSPRPTQGSKGLDSTRGALREACLSAVSRLTCSAGLVGGCIRALQPQKAYAPALASQPYGPCPKLPSRSLSECSSAPVAPSSRCHVRSDSLFSSRPRPYMIEMGRAAMLVLSGFVEEQIMFSVVLDWFHRCWESTGQKEH